MSEYRVIVRHTGLLGRSIMKILAKNEHEARFLAYQEIMKKGFKVLDINCQNYSR